MARVTDIFRDSVLINLSLVDVVINNCSDELWEKKFGGDYYWAQVFHLIGGVSYFMGLVGQEGLPMIPENTGTDGILRKPSDPSLDHSKEKALAFNKEMMTAVAAAFDRLDDSTLFTPIDFYGNPTTHGGMYSLLAAHILYHIGACDAALRDNGLTAAI
ncbi:MAG: hypothetical protein LBV09_05470 [Deferribacteraceae bacterium]|jgi:hypothetical protein|nr:hypothetical protein [Deferribacteraceae bacterium]